jgi:RNA polymerase sigma factor (sigma-70 family)
MELPLAYSRRILINLAIDGSPGRARWKVELESPAALTDGSVDALASCDDRAELLAALAQLPVRQRAVLVLRYFNDLTEAQVAEALRCSVGTVKSNASRGLARLRDALQPAIATPGGSDDE